MSEYLGFQPVSEEYICSGKPFYFISYNSQDINYITPVVLKLHEMGVPLWYDYGIPYNSKWTGVIVDKIRKCRAVLFFLTWGIITKVGPNDEDPYTMKEYKIARRANKEVFVSLIDQIDSVKEFNRIPSDKVEFIMDIESRQSIPVFKDPENLDWITNEICNAIGFVPKEATTAVPQKNEPKESNQVLDEVCESLDTMDVASEKSDISSSFQIENGVLQKFGGKETEVVIPDDKAEFIIDIEGRQSIPVFKDSKNLKRITNEICNAISKDATAIAVVPQKNAPKESDRVLNEAYENPDIANIASETSGISSSFQIENGVLKKFVGTEMEVVIPDGVTSIGNQAFAYCESLTNVIIPDGVVSIGKYAFSKCKILTNITISNSVTSIGDHAFAYCERMTDIIIPDSVTSIGDYIFFGCYNLKEIFYTGTKEQWDDLKIQLHSAIKIHYSWVNNINKTELSSKKSTPLSSFQIENGVLRKFLGDETNIYIPDSVTSIQNYAFKFCKRITSIIIPDSVTSIGDSAFFGCYNLKEIFYTGTEEQWNKLKFGRHFQWNVKIHFDF